MKHLDEKKIARYNTGEVSWFLKFRIEWHLRGCTTCRERVENEKKLTRQIQQLPKIENQYDVLSEKYEKDGGTQ